MAKRIFYDSDFVKSIKKLPSQVQNKLKELELIFRIDPFSPRLKTHKLHGKLKNYYAFSINYKYRVIFKLIKKGDIIVFVDIGTHEIYE